MQLCGLFWRGFLFLLLRYFIVALTGPSVLYISRKDYISYILANMVKSNIPNVITEVFNLFSKLQFNFFSFFSFGSIDK